MPQSMVALYKEVTVEGVHYGTIPGTDKPMLWQRGAELLALFHGLRVVTRITSRIEDWDGTAAAAAGTVRRGEFGKGGA